MTRVAINGFGRIGRMVFRVGLERKGIEFVAINDLTSPENLAYLLKYDSSHGTFSREIKAGKDFISIDGKKIKVLQERNPETLPWKELDVDAVVESTGIFRTKEGMEKHLNAGAKKVLLSAPAKDDSVKTIVMGVNDNEISDNERLLSNASCTTNCLAPIVKVLQDAFGIEKGFMTTIHAYTADQMLQDAPHKDFRRGRSAAVNIVPTSTGAATAVTKVIPELKGRLDGMAVRVPVKDGSLTDFVATLETQASQEELKKVFLKASRGKMKGILDFSEEELVSSDIINHPASSIIDWKSCKVNGKLVKVISWYDNEFGYSNRMIDIIEKWLR
jgi:glyceraldehyde 3-phosphate dehydrogenase